MASDRLISARDRHDNGLPIVSLDFAAGQRIEVSSDFAMESEILERGSIMITSTVDVFLSIAVGADASDAPGSMFLAAGMPMHLVVDSGERVSALSLVDAGAVFIVPLR